MQRSRHAPKLPAEKPGGIGGKEKASVSLFIKKLLTAVLCILLLAYVGYQAYLALYHPIVTGRASTSTVQKTISADVFALHDEIVINGNAGTGVLDYTLEDGENVSKGGVVAKIYASAQDAENEEAISQLKSKISQLERAGTYEDTTEISMNVIDGEINNNLLTLADAVSGSSLDKLDDASGNLLNSLNTRLLATGEVNNFNAKIAELQAKVAQLQAETSSSTQSVTSPVPGCFVGSADGFEGLYDFSKVLQIKPSEVSQLLSATAQAPSGKIGKVYTQYIWYLVCNLSNDDVKDLSVGSKVNIQFPLSSQGEVPVTVAAINQSGDTDAVVLKCEYMTKHLAGMRKQTVQIIAKEYTGIKIDNNYIHIVNGQKGVYVLVGTTARFRAIDPIYSGNGYTLSEIDTTQSNLLQINDLIIENGEGLYDGKIVN